MKRLQGQNLKYLLDCLGQIGYSTVVPLGMGIVIFSNLLFGGDFTGAEVSSVKWFVVALGTHWKVRQRVSHKVWL